MMNLKVRYLPGRYDTAKEAAEEIKKIRSRNYCYENWETLHDIIKCEGLEDHNRYMIVEYEDGIGLGF